MIPAFATDAIDVSFTVGQTYTIRHGMGRQVRGWVVIWRDAPGEVYAANPAADTRQELALIPTASFDARLVLLS
jgi:hypothetical protein